MRYDSPEAPVEARGLSNEQEISVHSPEQIAAKLRDAEVMLNTGKDLAPVLQTLEVCEATYHRWRNQFGGMKSEEARRLKELGIEDARLKRLLVKAELDRANLTEPPAVRFSHESRQLR